MILFKPLEHLDKKYSIREKENLFKGSCGKIYGVQGDLVKIPADFSRWHLLNDKLSQKRLYNEAKIQNFAHSLGIKLPEVYGLFAVREEDSNIYYPGIGMKDLGRLVINNLNGSLRNEAERQRDIEIEKARDFGFVIKDSNDLNAIWVAEEEQTYLIDCGLWDYKG